MKTVNISLTELRPAPWNPNQMDETMMSRLRESISKYGLVEPLVTGQDFVLLTINLSHN